MTAVVTDIRVPVCSSLGDLLKHKKESSSSIVILSFNCLAPCFVRVPGQHWNAYSWCPSDVLEWSKRQRELLRVLKLAKVDVICLQEVQYEEKKTEEWDVPAWLQELAAGQGYTVVLQSIKPAQMSKMAARNEKVVGQRAVTGLAILYRTDLFEEYAASEHQGRSMCLHLQQKQAVESKEEDAPTTSGGQRISVANVHLEAVAEATDDATFSQKTEEEKALFFQKRDASIKKQLAQARSILASFSSRLALVPTHVIMCGDFNSECLASSELTQLLRQYRPKLQTIAPYATYSDPNSTPMCLDHMWMSGGLHVVCQTQLMSDATRQGGLPSAQWPSDHLPVAAVFEMDPLPTATASAGGAAEEATLMAEQKDSLEQQWLELQQAAPAKTRGKPTPEDLALLKAHAERKKTWYASLSEPEVNFLKTLDKKKGGGKKASKQ